MPTSKVAPSVRQSSVTSDLLLVTSQIEQDETISNNQKLQGPLSSVSALTTAPVSISTKNDVLTTEVLWSLKINSSHYSHKSFEASDVLFHKMFPDSVIAYNFKCGEVKSAYLITHEIAPYFKSLMINKLKNDSHGL